MMSDFPLPQEITYWPISGKSLAGDPTFGVGVKIPARWVRKNGIVKDLNGDDQKYNLVVYAETRLAPRLFLALGDFEGAASPDNSARQIIMTHDNPSSIDLYKMML